VLIDQILVSLAVAVFHATHPHAGGFFDDKGEYVARDRRIG
jgi:hypothetical protein